MLGLLIVALVAVTPAGALSQVATPVGAPSATTTAMPRSVVCDRVDVTVALRPDGVLHVTERDRVNFHGGPFRRGYREIPLARIETMDAIQVGEMSGNTVEPYRYVRPGDFAIEVPNTYTYEPVGDTMRIDWTFVPATAATRTFELSFAAHGALRVYDEAEPPFQQIAWIGVDAALTEGAPVTNASLTFILPKPVDPGSAAVRGPGGNLPAQHTMDGQAWTWTASDLRAGGLDDLARVDSATLRTLGPRRSRDRRILGQALSSWSRLLRRERPPSALGEGSNSCRRRQLACVRRRVRGSPIPPA